MNTSSAENNVFTSTFAAPTTSSLLQSPPPCFATLTPVSLSSASSHLLSHFTNQAILCNEKISAEASSITSPSLFSSSAPMISSSSSLNTLCDNKSRARLASVKPLNSNDLSAIIDMFKNVEDTNILSSSSLLEKVVPTSSALSSSFSLSSASCNRTPPLSPASVLRAPSVLNIFQSSRDSESDCMSSVATFSNTLVNSNNSNHDPITGRIMQFDGANDDGDDDDEESERQEEKQEEATAVDGVSFTSKSRHSKRTIKERKQMVDSRVQNDSGPLPRGTYKTVRVIPRPWKTPEGTVNRSSLASMLEAVCLYIAERPGVSTHALTNKYHPVLQPVAVLELLEMLDILGVTTKSYLKPINKPSLFSRRKVNDLGPLSNNPELEMNFVTADFMIKMGQFFNQLHANKRTDDDDD
ncbi:hypothetical protein HELRODRAFT_195154 [Helobdella robusta]|uniref:Uncharacterized protein n=1 Tax=Helobdella robusta TaxID=6412 RepID=T1FWT5_HELRO|nr:hypothetical protein HELRODRAFT_195154 [Helobdella robusta]ESO06734.1 hypothetical protein HELRODRAFT_195154 [Helobdella robusta]